MSCSNWAECFLQGFKSDDGVLDYRLRRIVEAELGGVHDEDHERA